ncbi:Amidohydrolase 2 [Penicillium concentricum]|uniref:6-methylsalicylate decarboxylase n=1 Tax=Penicillium concentricum TaxID=293559 RepID=A0A9W9V9S8_9EURO|nr:Amidohydrolase 2 [Penicillium concentricum]KAJ5374067.1 Amidohydrolase 2 [Penicillium concentricum]
MERIDVHTHCVPPSYREYCLQSDFAGKGHPDGMPAIPEWSAEAHINLMKKLKIKKSVLSMSSPATHLTPGNNEEGRSVTRRANIDMSKICADHPTHFLFFASLPLPDVEGSLAEIDYALDHLGAVGFQILTNSHGIYPGDQRFTRVFDKLSERKAIALFHPTTCLIRHGDDDDSVEKVIPLPGVPAPIMEFMFDSTRALMDLLTSGTVERCPGITFVVCHCGATFPPIMERIAAFSSMIPGSGGGINAAKIKKLLQTRFYFDLAGVPFPDQIHGLLRLVDSSRLVYGSDYPYTPAALVESLAKRVDEGLESLFGLEKTKQLLVDNAQELLGVTRG